MAWIGHLLGYPLPAHIKKKELFIIGLIAEIGLTVALFVAGEAFTESTIQGAAKMGALFSAVSGLIAVIMGKVWRIKRIG